MSPLPPTKYAETFFIKKLCMGEQTFWGKFMRLYAEYAELCRKCGIHFFVLDQKNPFWANLVKKNQNCQFKLKFGTKTNLNMRNSMMFTLSVFDHKYLTWANLVQKFKTVCSK